jgi:hypothetical protein
MNWPTEGSIPGRGCEFRSSPLPPIQRVPGALSPGLKEPGREADHSPPSTAEYKKAWNYTSTNPYVFMAYCLVKPRHRVRMNLTNEISEKYFIFYFVKYLPRTKMFQITSVNFSDDYSLHYVTISCIMILS